MRGAHTSSASRGSPAARTPSASRTPGRAAARAITVSFASAGANADGYTAATLTLTPGAAHERMHDHRSAARANRDGYTATTVTFTPRDNDRERRRQAPPIVRAPFGVLPSGDSVHVFTLVNASGVELRAIDYGGHRRSRCARRTAPARSATSCSASIRSTAT